VVLASRLIPELFPHKCSMYLIGNLMPRFQKYTKWVISHMRCKKVGILSERPVQDPGLCFMTYFDCHTGKVSRIRLVAIVLFRLVDARVFPRIIRSFGSLLRCRCFNFEVHSLEIWSLLRLKHLNRIVVAINLLGRMRNRIYENGHFVLQEQVLP